MIAEILKRIFFGLLGIGIGFLVIWKEHLIVKFVGKAEWAEEYLRGLGKTHALYKIIGLAIIIISLFYMVGLLDNIVKNTLGRFFIAV